MSQTQSAYSSTARVTAGIIAIAALTSMAMQSMINESGVAENFVLLFRFFTIWSNFTAALLLAWIARGRQVPPAILAALATALTVVGSVYWTLLSADHYPVGLDIVTNQIFHSFVPAATLLWWFAFAPRPKAIATALPVIMIPPLCYGAFAFVLGEATGFYAYFFLELPELGWTQFLINNVGLALFFALIGAILLGIKSILPTSTRSPALG